MPDHVLKKGLDLPITGVPRQEIHDGPVPTSVALIGHDTIGLKPKMLVAEGDTVRRGDPLFAHKDSPEVLFTAPMTGKVRAINRGARRVLESVVIDISQDTDPGVDFGAADPAALDRDAIAEKICASGLWPGLRTRPYSKVPDPARKPDAIFVTAMDTEPLAPDVAAIIAGDADAFRTGLVAVSRLTEGTTYLCHAPGVSLPGADLPGVEVHAFAGPHPAGLAGTHIHFLKPPGQGQFVWTVGFTDVIAIGALFLSGHLDPTRIVALTGPRAADPRLVRTVAGISLAELTAGEATGSEPLRTISGSVLTGRAADGAFAYLGRFARQVTLITEDQDQVPLGWIRPRPDKYAVQPVLISSLFGRKLHALTSNMNGGRRAMVPIGTFEKLMPQDYLPTQLLRALLVQDTDTAQALGALELDEEDLALCTFACPAKYEYGQALRDSLAKIEKEG